MQHRPPLHTGIGVDGVLEPPAHLLADPPVELHHVLLGFGGWLRVAKQEADVVHVFGGVEAVELDADLLEGDEHGHEVVLATGVDEPGGSRGADRRKTSVLRRKQPGA